MWVLNNNRWVRNTETLSKTSYDNLKQDISKTRLYSKCLSGSLYSSLIDLDSVYFSNKYKDDSTWYIDFSKSQYINNIQPTLNPTLIDIDEYNKYLIEYGFTTKTHFTPSNIIDDKLSNFKYVDLCTYDRENLLTSNFILDTNMQYNELYIDGVRVIDDHRILIENQITYITLSTSIDPDNYFEGKYYIIDQDVVNTRYYYFNNKNGVYVYKNGYLTREDSELLSYDTIDSVSYYVKLGNNKDKQFKLYRNSNGYYPLYNTNNSLEFYEFTNKILRTKLDYNNAFDISYNDVLYEDSYEINGVYIPNRIISVGEFGFINLTQNNKSNFIRNKFRYKLNNISSNTKNYLICGDQGTILLIDKITLNISRLSIDTKLNLNCIVFYDDLNGFVVGDFNTIFYTDNGGISWNRIYNEYFNGKDFTNVIYYNINRLYITGTNGILVECYRELNEWKLLSKKISKRIDKYDIIDLNYKINDCILCSSTDEQWDILPMGLDKYDFLIIVGDDSNIIIHPLSFKLEYEFYYLNIDNSTIGDILNIKSVNCYNHIINTSNNGILNLDITKFNILTSDSNIISSNDIVIFNPIMNNYYNNIEFDGYNIYGVGNFSKNIYIQYGTYSATYSYVETNIDETIYDNIVPKLLFLDYDVATKLNFFDDLGNYILPNDININIELDTLPLNYTIDINGDDNYTSWLDYFKDSLSTYRYYTNVLESNKVNFSTKFKRDINYIDISNPSINTDLNYILPCAPTISDIERTRYIKRIGDPNLSPTINNDFDILLFGYLMIIKTPLSNSDNIGDCIYMESDIISSYFIINNIVNIGSYKYVYLYTDFNDQIINNLRNSNNIKISNLNKFNDILDLGTKFNQHPISYGYKMNIAQNDNDLNITISPKFNNYTSYYNMGISLLDNYQTYISSYRDSYIKFGYNPMYNIYDYLNNIDSVKFNQDKVFTSIPSYLNLPCTNSNTALDNTLFIDTGKITNRIYFGSDFKYEYDTLLINIFYDIVLDTNNGIEISAKMLLINKYYDSDNNKYVVEFLDKIKYGQISNGVSKISILGRNTLRTISDDLNYINNISRSLSSKNIDNLYTISGYFNTNYKFNTDSYVKSLLSDGDIKSNINIVIYSDYNNKLSANFINFDNTELIDFVNISSYDVSTNITPDLRVRVNLVDKHNLSKGNIIYLSINNGSEYIKGCHIIYDIIDSYSLILETIYDTSYDTVSGSIKFDRIDIFSSIQPVDMYYFSSDKLPKRAMKINDNSYEFVNLNLSLYNIDRYKYRYELVDGLDLISINDKYSWVFEADIDDAIIGEDNNGLVWYKGDWSCGRFFGGTWYSGTWYSGDWYNGIWNSVKIKNNLYNVDVSNSYDLNRSIWYNGRFFGGTWNGGTWYNGRLYDVNWNNGIWYNGTWNGGTWNNGKFTGGIWIDGTWNNGYFSQDNRPSYWINGTWNNGYFENGRWFNGIFDMIDVSIFGSNSSLSSPAIWDSGIFKNGKLLSNNDSRSTIWKTGNWLNGTFNGGLSYNINFKKGTWLNGVSDDIEIVSINLNGDNNEIVLNGVFRFNSGDEITIINDYDDESIYNVVDLPIYDFRNIGSLYYPGRYRIIRSEIIDNKYTKLLILGRLVNGDPNVPTNSDDIYDDIRYKEYKDELNTIINKRMDIKLVSNFNNCDWYNGCWYNGVFESGNYYGGIWYNGKFNGNWG